MPEIAQMAARTPASTARREWTHKYAADPARRPLAVHRADRVDHQLVGDSRRRRAGRGAWSSRVRPPLCRQDTAHRMAALPPPVQRQRLLSPRRQGLPARLLRRMHGVQRRRGRDGRRCVCDGCGPVEIPLAPARGRGGAMFNTELWVEVVQRIRARPLGRRASSSPPRCRG